METEEYIQISTTVAKEADAKRMANVLLDKKLSACSQIIGPITSIYRWQGKAETAQEWFCVIKTKKSYFKNVERAIKEIHSYELPEIIATPIVEGSKEYLAWLDKEI